MQIVALSKGGAHAYFSALRQQRKVMALYYRSHPEATVKEVMARFRVSRATVNKALAENGMDVDRYRNPIFNSRYHSFRCPDCWKVQRHYCQSKNPVGYAGANTSELASHPHRERWTPEERRDIGLMSAWIERNGRDPTDQELRDGVWRSGGDASPPPAGDAPVAEETSEMKELAELGLAGLMERGRKELGLE